MPPTIWSGEVAQILFAAAVFFSLGEVLRRGRHIAVGIVQDHISARARTAAGVFSLTVIAAFSAVVSYWGGLIAWDSFVAGPFQR